MITIVEFISNLALLSFWLFIGAVSLFLILIFIYIILDNMKNGDEK
tara:strand:+ start:19446 stop:19583 length:138 start_codon:yes stop_codon:yes gene_type:complete